MNWPIQRIQQVEPALKTQVLVLEKPGSRGRTIAACCDRAAQSGVQPGMPLTEAKSLVRHGIAIRNFAPHEDRQVLETLAQECERFSPIVGLENAEFPASLLLDITGLSHLFGSERQLANQVRGYLERRGYRTQLAVAPTIGVAWGVSHFGDFLDSHPNSNTNPHAPFLVTDHNRQWIESLPVAALRIDDATTDLLFELGIQRLDQLMTIPREHLLARFGPQLSLRLAQFTGQVAETITSCKPTLPFVVEKLLDEPISKQSLIAFVIRELLKELTQRLQQQDVGATSLLCKFFCANRDIVSLPIYLFQPSHDANRMMELVELNLEQLRLPTEVMVISVAAPQTGRVRCVQLDLFSKEKSLDAHELALLVNRLSSRLGMDRVLFPRFRSSALPERVRSFAAATNAYHKKSNFQGQPQRDRRRPLLLYRRAIPIKVINVAPSGPPQVAWLPSGKQAIVRSWGPERIETGWWRGQSRRRDYYGIVTELGGWWWVFRRLQDGRWFLHGEFG